MMVLGGLNGCLVVWYIFYDLIGYFGEFVLNLIKRKGLYGRFALGFIAGVITIVFFNIDQIEFLAPNRVGTSAFNYSMIIVMFYILFVMNLIAGIRREFEVSLTYIGFMVLYDLMTDGLVTIMFAVLSFITLLVGLAASGLAKRLGITGED